MKLVSILLSFESHIFITAVAQPPVISILSKRTEASARAAQECTA